MYSGSIHSPGPTNGEKREPTTLNPTTIAQAVDRSADNGRTIVLSKLNLSDVSAEAAEELATVGRGGPDDDCIIERITLGNNRLTTLPTEFALLSRLRYLNLKHNNFANFPGVLMVMPSLDTLDISHNKIRDFPAQPGLLVNLRFKRLEFLKLDHDRIKWPPRSVLRSDIPRDGDDGMKEWIANILDWVNYNTSPGRLHDDSGYGEVPDWEISAKQDRHKAWRFPLRDIDADPASLSHNRGFSVDSAVSASSARDDSFIDADSTRNRSPFRTTGYPAIVTAPEHSPVRPSEPYLPSPADSEKFDLHSSSSQADLSELNRAPPLHLRASSVATENRQPASTYVPAKKSLPDLRSPQWHKLTDSPEQSYSTFLTNQHDPATTAPTQNIRQNSLPSNETRKAQGSSPSRSTPSMAFERNSYFQRLSTMPTSTKLPAPLLTLAETARSILFVTSQIYQTIEHYANHAIDEQHSLVFKRVLEPANTDMVNLIRALDLFDSTSQKSLPPPPVCRAIVEACRNTVSVTGKAVRMFGIQLGVAPCEDHRYSRWILLELYASTAEISVAWQNLLPHAEDLKPFLHGKLIHRQGLPLLQTPSFGPPTSHPSSAEEQFPALRLRNPDFASIRTHNARRHAGSFSYRDVELGKVLPSVEEPPIPSLRTPKRQVTAPPTAPSLNGSLSLPGPPHQPAFSLGRSEGASFMRHNRDHSFEQPLRSAPTSISKLKSLDLPAALRQKPDREPLQSIRQTLEAAPKICDMIEDAITPSDFTAKDLLRKLRELSRKLSISLRGAEGDKTLDAQMSENAHLLFKLVTQLANLVKNGTLSRSASPALLAQFTRLTESAEEFNKIYGASFPTTSRPYSPLFNHPFSSPSMEDNRLSSSLSRTRSAQPTPTLKTSISSFQDGPRSALPTSSFKLPNTSRLFGSHNDIMDPG
ncbi:hypothetical protein H1R20_g5656, partial [Candolleomyces eurysporus]